MAGPWLVSRGRFAAVAAAALLFFAGASPAVAQQGAVAGQVVRADDRRPVRGAQVFVPGTNLGTLTDENGRFRIPGVPPGQVEVRVRLLGYKQGSQTVVVRSGETATVNVQLRQTALKLQELVVTGVTTATPRVKLPFTVDQVNTADVPVPASDPITLLQGKAAGIRVVSGTGQPGSGSDIQLRGITSLDARGRSNQPLVIVDGVVAGRGQALTDLNTLDIKSIEVVKGGAAASLYGSRASNGVIYIETKKGEDLTGQQEYEFTLRNEYGLSYQPWEFSLSRFHPWDLNDAGDAFVRSDGTEFTDYTLEGGDVILSTDGPSEGTPRTTFRQQRWPDCTAKTCRVTQGSFDQLDQFFDPADSYSNYAALSGKIQEMNFRASFENFKEFGIVPNSAGFQRRNGRLNIQSSVGDDFNVTATGFYSHSNQDQVNSPGARDNPFATLTQIARGADLLREDDEGELLIHPDPNFLGPNPLFIVKELARVRKRDRVMASGQGQWQPTGWFDLEGTISFDRLEENFREFKPQGFPTVENPRGGPGSLLQLTDFDRAINGNVTASVGETLLDDQLTARFRSRYLFEESSRENHRGFCQDFAVPGVPSLGACTGSKSVDSGMQTTRTQAYFLAGSFDFRDRYIFDGLLRRDGSSLFGEDEQWHTFGRASVAYRLSEEPFFPDFGGALNEFKVRGSYGTSGGRPNWNAKFETFTIKRGMHGSGDLALGQLGNEELKPEIVKEWEGGLDMVLFDSWSLSGTYATSEVEDQILVVPQPAFQGFSDQWQNAGTVDNESWEVSLEGTVVDTDALTWNITASADRIEQTITELNVLPFTWGPNNIFRNEEGVKVGTMFGDRFATSCADLPAGVTCDEFAVNSDGYLVWVGAGNTPRDGLGSDNSTDADDNWGTSKPFTLDDGTSQIFEWGMPFVAADGTSVAIGDNQPTWSLSGSTNLRYKGFRLYALATASLDYDLYWSAGEARSSGAADTRDRPKGLKKPIHYYGPALNMGRNNSHFVVPGDFLKLRELSLSYDFPGSLLDGLFGGAIEGATLNLIGRNVLKIDDFPGYDPEAGVSGGFGGSATVTRVAEHRYPNFPSITGALELRF